MKRAIAVFAMTALLGGCSTKMDPTNWFGQGAGAAENSVKEVPQDPRHLAQQLVSVRAEKIPTGLLIQTTGLMPDQGWWDADLVSLPIENGVLTLEFRVYPPINATPVSTAQSREVVVAKQITNSKLQGVTKIEIKTAGQTHSLQR